jgi:hypothetical protein
VKTSNPTTLILFIIKLLNNTRQILFTSVSKVEEIFI